MNSDYVDNRGNTIYVRLVHTRSYPAINVKVHSFPCDADFNIYPSGFDREWIENNLAEWDYYFARACEAGWEDAEYEAKRIFGDEVEVYSDGRSGGWLIVDGIGVPEDWDEDTMAKWTEFRGDVDRRVDDVMPDMIEMMYEEEFLPARREATGRLIGNLKPCGSGVTD